MKKKTVKVSAVLLSLAIALTGTSGGGALSSVIGASGDSSDYFESLYAIGAAGIEKDGDSSFAVETILRYSIWNNEEIRNKNFEFAWLKVHLGDYDVTEAYAWLDSVLAAE